MCSTGSAQAMTSAPVMNDKTRGAYQSKPFSAVLLIQPLLII